MLKAAATRLYRMSAGEAMRRRSLRWPAAQGGVMKTTSFLKALVVLTMVACLAMTAGCVPGTGDPFANLVFLFPDIEPKNPVIQAGKTQQFSIIFGGDQDKKGDPTKFNWA